MYLTLGRAEPAPRTTTETPAPVSPMAIELAGYDARNMLTEWQIAEKLGAYVPRRGHHPVLTETPR